MECSVVNNKNRERPERMNSFTDGARPQIVGFREMLPLIRPYRLHLVVALAIGIAGTAAAAAQPVVVARIVDAFSGEFPLNLAVVLIVLLLASAAFTALRQLIMQRAGERFAFDTRDRLVRHIYAMPMSRLDRRNRADLVSRVTTDVSQIREILTSGLVELISAGVTVLVSIVMMAFIDPVLLGLAVATVAIIVFSVYAIGRKTRPAGLRLQESIGELASSVSCALGAMKTIRASRSIGREADASVSFARKALNAGLSVAGLRAIIQAFSGTSVQVLLIIVIGVGALRVSSGILSTGEMSAFIMYLMLMAAPLAMFGGIIAMLGEAFGALARILDVEAEVRERDVLDPEKAGKQFAGDDEAFRLEQVSFEYDSSPGGGVEAALRDVSAVIPKGKVTAIVGPSGAGKSTLFALLERFYEPTSGRILFSGEDVQGLSRDALRSEIAYVDQESVVLSGSIRDNIQLAAPRATDGLCAQSLVQVGLAQDYDDALRILDDEVGELGARLSGGERQRLAIARALVAEASILLLDEITSNLDSRNEALVKDLLLSTDGSRTVLVIAHRFSTVVSADLILVMDAGRLIAQGTHAQLLDGSELYRELAEKQFVVPGSIVPSDS